MVLHLKFSLIVPCEKEIVIHDEKEFNENKESFLLAFSDENDCQLLLSDYIEEYGIYYPTIYVVGGYTVGRGSKHVDIEFDI